MLTDDEMDILYDLASASSKFSKLIKNPHDTNEWVFYMHGLQNMILAQSAGREYPEKYRIMK